MKILNYGSLNIDTVFKVPHIVCPGETIAGLSVSQNAGGKGANQSIALGKAGIPVYHAGKTGKDGDWLIANLKRWGVDTSFIVQTADFTGRAFIQVDENSQNAIVLHAGGNGEITLGEIEETLSHFGLGDLLILQNEIAHISELITAAHRKGMEICFNPSPFDDKIFDLPLDLLSMIIVNEIEGAGLAGLPKETPFEKILDALVKKFPNAEIILTAGKAGALYGFADKRARGDIIDVPVVDTTAAGDTFTGYFWAARIKGCAVDECLRLACKASSLAVSRPGASDSVPLADEVFG